MHTPEDLRLSCRKAGFSPYRKGPVEFTLPPGKIEVSPLELFPEGGEGENITEIGSILVVLCSKNLKKLNNEEQEKLAKLVCKAQEAYKYYFQKAAHSLPEAERNKYFVESGRIFKKI